MLSKVGQQVTHCASYQPVARSLQKVAETPSSLQKLSLAPPPVHLQNYVQQSTSIQTATEVSTHLQSLTKKPTSIQKLLKPPSHSHTSSRKPCSKVIAILSNAGLPPSQKLAKSPSHGSKKKPNFSSILSGSGLPLQSQPRRSLTSNSYDFCLLDRNYLQTSDQKVAMYADAFQVEPEIAEMILYYSKHQPTPISIEELMARGVPGAVPEEHSCKQLVYEVTVRLSHMLMEMYNLPQQVKDQQPASDTIKLYTMSFTEILQFRGRDSSDKQVLRDFMETLERFKRRHSGTVVEMANAVRMLREKTGMSVIDPNSGLANCVQYYLDRLYMARISIHMITNQHLMVYGNTGTSPGLIGVIDPRTYVSSSIVDAFDDASFLCEQSYTVAPKLQIKTLNLTKQDEESGNSKNSVVCGHVPAHMYHIFFEMMKNAMRATVENHWDNRDNLPPIKVLVTQSNFDVTVKISDQGGGMERDLVERKIFQYLYSSSPDPRITIDQDFAPMFGLGYGLPLSRLYAKYFRGDLKIASYEGYGTDVYVYLHSLARNAREHLPVYNTTSSRRMTNLSARIPGWTSNARFNDNRITENSCIRS